MKVCDRWKEKIKVNSFVIYRTPHSTDLGVVLLVNSAGGTLKVLNTRGQIKWFVTSSCEVILT